MTLRDKWTFGMKIGEVLAGAKAKRDHHNSRVAWWEAKKSEVFATIKEGGLKISESLVSQYAKTGYATASVDLEVDPDLQKKLDECVRKIGDHRAKADSYAAYVEVLSTRPGGDTIELAVEDWQFFFGK